MNLSPEDESKNQKTTIQNFNSLPNSPHQDSKESEPPKEFIVIEEENESVQHQKKNNKLY